MIFSIALSFIVLVLGFAVLRSHVVVWRLSRLDWTDLLGRLEPVSVEGIAAVALDYLHPVKGQLQLGPAEMWVMIGGDEGVRRMYANVQIMIALAGYAERWNPLESAIVAERMRRDGIALRRAILRLSLGSFDWRGNLLGPFDLHEAASSYYLMRQRLLALYETSHIARYPSLVSVV